MVGAAVGIVALVGLGIFVGLVGDTGVADAVADDRTVGVGIGGNALEDVIVRDTSGIRSTTM